MYVRPKKHLGQHFLTDMNIAKAIADALSSDTTCDVIEVGPGTGVLTQFLLQREELNLKVAEVDDESIEYLQRNFLRLDCKNIVGDFIKLDLEALFEGKFSVIGNFPYNISSQIFFKILENRDMVPECVCMIQKEVAERIAEPPGKKLYGILSVLLQAFYDIEYLFTVHENVFNPPPKVKSAVIRLRRNSRVALDCDEKLFFRVVKGTFNQRRKTIKNSLKAAFSNIDPTVEHPLYTQRPEKLSVEQFMELTNFVAQNLLTNN
ncbi:MAG: 16S rRNA (adenine(1518)-N(6)/adenine(1519)-N(6))-dimethyltransferase RsmA [Rikenellaceae bacterium]